MKGRYKRKEPSGAPLRALLEEEASADPDTQTVKDRGRRKKGTRCSVYGGEKVYLGVRVRMPVKDLLKNIRVSQGQDAPDFKERDSKSSPGNPKRVRTRSRRKAIRVQCSMKSLEELAIITEVLEEDLRTSNSCSSSPQNLSSSNFPVCPDLSLTGYGDEGDEIIPSPESYISHSPSTAESYPAWPPDCMFSSFQPSNNNWNLNGSAFFWAQLQKEENQLRAVSDEELLATNEHGRTALHKVVCIGKRALGYAIAKRMTSLNSLDLKDSDGMTALLYAAKHNQHLMVADLISLGANVNERNNSGKSCLHLSAENGYIRVLEVLKQAILDGVYIDIEATDNSGLSVLQCAAVALKTSVSEMESNGPLNHSRLHSLHQVHMMETLECLLQMDSYLHTTASPSAAGEPEYAAQSWCDSQHIRPAGRFENPTVMF